MLNKEGTKDREMRNRQIHKAMVFALKKVAKYLGLNYISKALRDFELKN